MTAPKILAFVTEAFEWASRWEEDPGMFPWHLPVFGCHAGRLGFLLGPYLSEREEIRRDPYGEGAFVARYRSWDRAKSKMELEPRDFVPAEEWLRREYPGLELAQAALLEAHSAIRTGNVPAYREATTRVVQQIVAERMDRKRRGELAPMTDWTQRRFNRDRELRAEEEALDSPVAMSAPDGKVH